MRLLITIAARISGCWNFNDLSQSGLRVMIIKDVWLNKLKSKFVNLTCNRLSQVSQHNNKVGEWWSIRTNNWTVKSRFVNLTCNGLKPLNQHFNSNMTKFFFSCSKHFFLTYSAVPVGFSTILRTETSKMYRL